MNLAKVQTLGSDTELTLTSKYAIPEVAFPYIYMPVADFNQIADHLNKFYHYHSTQGTDFIDEIPCAKSTGLTLGKCQMKNEC